MLPHPELELRPARAEECDEIRNLIVLSARELSGGYYHAAQIEAAITHVFGVDTTLIADGTYFVAESAGVMQGCGGWSKRRTLFGGDQYECPRLRFLRSRCGRGENPRVFRSSAVCEEGRWLRLAREVRSGSESCRIQVYGAYVHATRLELLRVARLRFWPAD